MTPYTPEQVSTIDKLIRANGIGVVYIVAHDPAGPVKIGKSTFLSVRLDGLQTGNPSQLYVFAAFLASHGQIRLMEARTHAALQGARLRGEWFAMPVDEAKQACRAAIKRYRPTAFKAPDVQIEGRSGTSTQKTKKPTNRSAFRAHYKKLVKEMSLRVPQCPSKASRNKWALPK
ncbi:GIY-YIG nuclease family protein [Mesorhizobium sp. M1409]|uniref:GIY-YIG nuclease family protein n=1 Tax=Mesorhizobium sp. M1409 TaxID=2957100 RepID=UPI0033396D8E